jgi:sugar phosphate isomerase/epimerase
MTLLDAPVGCVPIVWNNADLHDLAPETPAATVLDEIARLGFAGTQHGRGLPEGDVLKAELAARGFRFAELYSALPAGPDGLDARAADLARRDLGRLVAGGGDPVEAIGRYGPLVTHVHLKDVDAAVLARLRAGEVVGLGDAVRNRIFTELGHGAVDLDGVLRALDRIGYSGWLMVEQDSTWLRPSEAAAIGRRVLEFARRLAVREAAA